MKKYILPILILLSSCAQFVPPTGGPKDEKPPELTVSYPLNKTKNFNGRNILLEFNELIDAAALRQELIITPQPPGTYDLKEKPYGIELKFDKPFSDSTTYTLNFRGGIKDLAERNPANNLKLVFSTGPEIDSLTLQGKITNLWTGKPADKTTVGLYNLNEQSDTIPLFKTKPSYFIKTDSSGKYNFENLKPGNYRLLAFTDENQNLTFDSRNELFAFLPDTVKLDTLNPDIDLQIYPSNTEEIKVRRSLARQGYFSIQYNKPLMSARLLFPATNDSLTYKLMGEELHIFAHPSPGDTTLTNIIVQDSVGKSLEHSQKIYFSTTTSKSKTETISLQEQQYRNNTKIKVPSTYVFNFSTPIISIDTSKISLLSDSTKTEPFALKWLDSSQTAFAIDVKPSSRKFIQLSISSGAITNYKSDTNSTYSLINTIYQQDEFGSLDGAYPQFEGQKIAELIDDTKGSVVDRQIFTDKFSFPQTIPGTYKIRIIEDKNSNGQWDTGSFEANQLPERIIVSKGSIKLKANFQLSDIQME